MSPHERRLSSGTCCEGAGHRDPRCNQRSNRVSSPGRRWAQASRRRIKACGDSRSATTSTPRPTRKRRSAGASNPFDRFSVKGSVARGRKSVLDDDDQGGDGRLRPEVLTAEGAPSAYTFVARALRPPRLRDCRVSPDLPEKHLARVFMLLRTLAWCCLAGTLLPVVSSGSPRGIGVFREFRGAAGSADSAYSRPALPLGRVLTTAANLRQRRRQQRVVHRRPADIGLLGQGRGQGARCYRRQAASAQMQIALLVDDNGTGCSAPAWRASSSGCRDARNSRSASSSARRRRSSTTRRIRGSCSRPSAT